MPSRYRLRCYWTRCYFARVYSSCLWKWRIECWAVVEQGVESSVHLDAIFLSSQDSRLPVLADLAKGLDQCPFWNYIAPTVKSYQDQGQNCRHQSLCPGSSFCSLANYNDCPRTMSWSFQNRSKSPHPLDWCFCGQSLFLFSGLLARRACFAIDQLVVFGIREDTHFWNHLLMSFFPCFLSHSGASSRSFCQSGSAFGLSLRRPKFCYLHVWSSAAREF